MANERTSTKLTLSFVVGLVLVPLSAVAAVALLGGGKPSEANAAETTATTAPLEVQQIVFGAVGEATSEDLAAACGPAGEVLVAAELDGSITPVQQAALDALRPICDSLGTPLAPKQGPEAMVRTVTRKVYVAAAPAVTVESPLGETSSETRADASDSESESKETSATTTAAAELKYQSLHDQAVVAIADAIAAGGNAEKIREAQSKLSKAESKAAQGQWQEAISNAGEALGQAREALNEEEDD